MKTATVIGGLVVIMTFLSGCGNTVVPVSTPSSSGASAKQESEGIMPIGDSIDVQRLQHDTGDAYELRIDQADGTWRWYGTDSAVYMNQLSTDDGTPTLYRLGTNDSVLTIKNDAKTTKMVLTRLPNQGDTTEYILAVPPNQSEQGGTVSYDVQQGKSTSTYTLKTQIVGQSK